MLRIGLNRCVVIAAALSFVLTALPSRAADDTVLRRVSGSVGYTAVLNGPQTAVTGSQTVADNSYAVTGANSQGVIKLADSSEIGLGSITTVQVGAFRRAADGSSGTTITVPNTAGGTLRFDIKHPAGAKSSYTFVTPTTSVGVRGTIGLLSSGANGDTISCIACAPNDVAVTITSSGRVFPLLTGQTLVVSIAGVVTTVATTTAILQSFSGAGLSTSSAAASPVVGGAAASGAAAGVGGAAVGAAAVGAAAIGVTSASTTKSDQGGRATPQPSGQPTATPSATPTPLATTTGTGTIQNRRRGR